MPRLLTWLLIIIAVLAICIVVLALIDVPHRPMPVEQTVPNETLGL